MALPPGTRLGPYEIVGGIGAGGMGEVYRAHDSRLGRDVALKTLPEALSGDPDRLARFEREARTLASLNHPNIAGLYGIEDVPASGPSPAIHALVMELVPGRTLSEIIDGRPLPVADAIGIARQIAIALEAAHDAGIIHRDLKPANVKVTGDDVVKVLDFGLARAGAGETALAGVGDRAATVTSPAMTQAGVILGTAAYMAPEQARGKPIDRRADIWAFGVVVHEMLTGRRLFEGDSVTDVLAQVLTRTIDLGALPAETPVRLRELVARCLERDPKRRLRDIGEARIALTEPAVESAATGAVGPAPASVAHAAGPRSRWVPWAIAGVSAIAAIALGIDRFASSPASVPADRSRPLVLEIGPPPDGDFIVGSNAGAIVISPDASTVAFLVQTSAGRKLFVRSLASGETRAVPGVTDPGYPFWSPDSRKIGYFGNTKLYTVNLAGGLPEPVADIQQGRGGTWTDTGVILFTPSGGGTVHRVSERGGEKAQVTKLDDSRGENAHYWPVALPGGRKFLYFVRSTLPENNGIYIASVDGSTRPVRVLTSLSSGLYSPPRPGVPGRLLWVRDGNLLAQAMDPETGALSGEVATISSDVRVEDSQRGAFASVANDGSVVWASAGAAAIQMATVDRDGRRLTTLPLPLQPGKLVHPEFSPDDRKLSFTRVAGGTADVWIYDFASKEERQLTTDPDYDEAAVWSPDSRDVFYSGRRNGAITALITPVDRSRPEQEIARGAGVGVGRYAHDGRSVFVSRNAAKDLALVRLSDPSKPIPVTPDPGLESEPALSPDGRWLAFTSDRSGRSEVVLASYQDDGKTVTLGGERIPVSVGGGVRAQWRRDGKEILYTAPDGTVTAVSVAASGASLELGRPTPLAIVAPDLGGGWTANSTHTLFVVLEVPRAIRQTFRVMLGAK